MDNKNPICPWCNKEVSGFNDKTSLKEFRISGLCQKCQDATFKTPIKPPITIELTVNSDKCACPTCGSQDQL